MLYRFKFIKVLTVSNLIVLSLTEKRWSKSSYNSFSKAILNGKGCHFHCEVGVWNKNMKSEIYDHLKSCVENIINLINKLV